MDGGDDTEQEHGDHYIGRYVENALGQQEIVHLSQRYWDYLDWFAEQNLDVPAYIKACDLKRKAVPLSDALAWHVYWTFLEREKQGLPRPDWLGPPEPWEDGEG